MDTSNIYIVQSIIWLITLITTIFVLYWTYVARKTRRQFWNITIPQLFYLVNQLVFYSCVLWTRYNGITISELLGLGKTAQISELWSALLRLQGTITLLAIAFIVKSYLKRIPYDSIYLR